MTSCCAYAVEVRLVLGFLTTRILPVVFISQFTHSGLNYLRCYCLKVCCQKCCVLLAEGVWCGHVCLRLSCISYWSKNSVFTIYDWMVKNKKPAGWKAELYQLTTVPMV